MRLTLYLPLESETHSSGRRRYARGVPNTRRYARGVAQGAENDDPDPPKAMRLTLFLPLESETHSSGRPLDTHNAAHGPQSEPRRPKIPIILTCRSLILT